MGLGVPFEKSVVIQNAIDPIPLTEDDKKSSVIKLIYHTTPHRGLELLVPVVEHLAEKYFPNIHLDVYSSFGIYGWNGRDEQYKDLFRRIERSGVMTYHGHQPNSVIREALTKAHIFAYPNIWPETSCIAAIEAMSAGCQIVAPNFHALPETCANFAAMYPFQENVNSHANLFANVLANAIQNYWNESTQNKLKFQKIYTDNFYSWDLRAAQWNGFLESLTQ
jgi:glycosyltransferase involved in cell wall biosynthesis